MSGLVIRALGQAYEPSHKDTVMQWNDEAAPAGCELFRNDLVYSTRVMPAASFEKNLSFKFSSKASEGLDAIDLSFSKADFVEVEGEAAEALFKMAVLDQIRSEPSTDAKKQLSLKHQVLCDETAMVGVIKMKDKASGELVETKVTFGKSQLGFNEPEPVTLTEILSV